MPVRELSLRVETDTEYLPCSTVSEEIAMNRMFEGDREGMVLQREMDLGGTTLGSTD